MGCSVAQFVVMGLIIFYCFLKIRFVFIFLNFLFNNILSDWQWAQVRFNYSAEEFPVSIGVIVFSYTSQLFLPSLEGDMEKRSQFMVWKIIIFLYKLYKIVYIKLILLVYLDDVELDTCGSSNFKSIVFIGLFLDMG